MIGTIGIREGRWGTIKYFLKDYIIGKCVHYYGEYSPEETEFILSIADKSKLTLDIGANIGCISQALAHEGYPVVAFEPQPEVYKLLQFNCPNIPTFNVAVGKEKGTAFMPKLSYSEKNNFGAISLNTSSFKGNYPVSVLSIDSYEFQNVGLMKLDVEGFEEPALRGAEETIKKYRPILYVEDDRPEKSISLRKYIKELGYTIEEHKPFYYREGTKTFSNYNRNVWDRYIISSNIVCRPQ